MLYHVPEGLMRHYILLAAVLTVMALYNCATIQAVLLFALWYMRHVNFFLKISTKKYKKPFFFVRIYRPTGSTGNNR